MNTIFTAYHVAGPKWSEGDSLKTWNTLVAEGTLTDGDWQWPDCEIDKGDTDVICFYATLAEAIYHREEFGGTIVQYKIDLAEYLSGVELEDAASELSEYLARDADSFDLPTGNRLVRVEEGYGAFQFEVAPWMLTVVK